jgi:hypothetical protein
MVTEPTNLQRKLDAAREQRRNDAGMRPAPTLAAMTPRQKAAETIRQRAAAIEAAKEAREAAAQEAERREHEAATAAFDEALIDLTDSAASLAAFPLPRRKRPAAATTTGDAHDGDAPDRPTAGSEVTWTVEPTLETAAPARIDVPPCFNCGGRVVVEVVDLVESVMVLSCVECGFTRTQDYVPTTFPASADDPVSLHVVDDPAPETDVPPVDERSGDDAIELPAVQRAEDRAEADQLVDELPVDEVDERAGLDGPDGGTGTDPTEVELPPCFNCGGRVMVDVVDLVEGVTHLSCVECGFTRTEDHVPARQR